MFWKLDWEKLPVNFPEELDKIELVIYPVDSIDYFHRLKGLIKSYY